MNFDQQRILVIDDDADAREMTIAIIESLGLVVTGTDSATTALELLKKHHFDAVLCDINMPGMGGLQLLTEMRKLAIDSDFIFLTGFDDGNILRQARHLGAVVCLQKPFQISDLEEALAQASDSGNLRRKTSA